MKNYKLLLEDILNNGLEKNTENGKVLSVFGRNLRYSMKYGFPLDTTKKMYFRGIVTELLWSLRGDTNIKYLINNDCHIWDGDAYKKYLKTCQSEMKTEQSQDDSKHWFSQELELARPYPKDVFIQLIKTNSEFAKRWGELGPIHGKQWRKWTYKKMYLSTDGSYENIYADADQTVIDQISNLIDDLKRNPDSRCLMVNAWNVSDLDKVILPPFHYSFQVYTKELTLEERYTISRTQSKKYNCEDYYSTTIDENDNLEFTYKHTREEHYNIHGIPKRKISLMFNMRSNNAYLGLPLNVATCALLLEIIARMVNMVPDELIVNLGESYIDINQIEDIKKEINTETYPLSKINIKNDVNFDGSIDDMLNSCDVDSFIIN